MKTGLLWYPYHGKDLWNRMKRVRWRLGRKDTGSSKKTCVIRSRDAVTLNPSQAVTRKVVRKTMFEKKPPRLDRNIRTPFREKAGDHSTERVTGAELRKRTRCCRCRQLGHMARECQNPAPKDIPQSAAKNFFLPGDAFCTVA